MSKRFGRNQKRQARERIAQLEDANKMASGLSSHLTNELRRNQEAAAQIFRMLPEMTIASPPKTGMSLRRREAPKLGDPPIKIEFGRRFNLSSMQEDASMFITMDDLLTLFVDLEVDEMLDPGMIHCYVDFADQRAVYAITRRALEKSKADWLCESLAREIGTRVAKLLVKKLRPNG